VAGNVLRDFRQFVLRGNVVDLAVAVVVGAAFGSVVQSLVADLLTPLIAAAGGESSFEGLAFSLNESEIRIGRFLNAVIAFLLVAAVVFFLVVRPVNALVARFRPEPPPDAPTRACPECLSDIPAAARRCAFCTAPVEGA
jgi:large conductance mechanosensitive channel